MSFLENLQDELPDRNRLLYLLALTVIGAAVLGDLVLAVNGVIPNWRNWQAVNSQLQQVEVEKARAQSRLDDRTVEDIQADIEVAEGDLVTSAGLFLSEAYAGEVLNSLFRYASESGTRVVSLESQPVPVESEEPVASPLYEIRKFHLAVSGSVADLLVFLSLLEDVRAPGVAVSDVVLVSDADGGKLEMNVFLVVSAYAASSEAEIVDEPDSAVPAVVLNRSESEGWQQVIDGLSELLATDPGNEAVRTQLYTAYITYGDQLMQENQPDAARVQFEYALEVEPGSSDTVGDLAPVDQAPPTSDQTEASLAAQLNAAWEAEEWSEAIALLHALRRAGQVSVEWTDKLYDAYVNHGYQLADAGSLTDAKEAFSTALQLKPDGTEATEGLRYLAESPLSVPQSAPSVP